MQYAKEILLKKLFETSEVLQKLVFSKEKSEKIKKIGVSFNLSSEKTIHLEELVDNILIGLEPLSKFRSLIVGEVGTTYDQAIKISSETNTQIFEPVMGELKNFEDKNSENEPADGQAKISDTTKNSRANHLLPSHEMIHEPHLHSQTLMPKDGSNKIPIKTAFSAPYRPPVSRPIAPVVPIASKPTPTSTPIAQIPVPKPPAPKFSSIVDQKLSKLVRTERDQAQVKTEVEERRKNTYTSGDPYREPIK